MLGILVFESVSLLTWADTVISHPQHRQFERCLLAYRSNKQAAQSVHWSSSACHWSGIGHHAQRDFLRPTSARPIHAAAKAIFKARCQSLQAVWYPPVGAVPSGIIPMHPSSSSRRRTSSLLSLPLLLDEHLLPEDLLDHPQVVRLAVDDILQLLDVLAELLDFCVVESGSGVGGLLDVEARADVDEHVAGAGELAGDVEGGG